MTFVRALQIAAAGLPVIARFFAGGILCFFAFIPGWIIIAGISNLVSNPHEIEHASRKDILGGFLVFGACCAVLYFLLLLAYRAFTNRGRKQDGGLLPPWGLFVIAVVFSLSGAAISAIGIIREDALPIFGGLIDFLMGASVFRLARKRARRATS